MRTTAPQTRQDMNNTRVYTKQETNKSNKNKDSNDSNDIQEGSDDSNDSTFNNDI
jgi:hypothetical protein